MRKTITCALFFLALLSASNANAKEWRYWISNGRVDTIWRASLESEDSYQAVDQAGRIFLTVIDNSRNPKLSVLFLASSRIETIRRFGFDDEALQNFNAPQVVHGRTITFEDRSFIRRLRTAQSLVVELNLSDHGLQLFRFNVAGFRLQGPHSQEWEAVR
jgi:hypothetical protein